MNRAIADRAFVTAQVLLAAGLALSVARSPTHSPMLGRWIAATLLIAAISVAARAARDLRGSFRIGPGPATNARFVQRGIYRHLRHPMYNAVALCIVAMFALRPGPWVAVAATSNLLFYVGKSIYEERLLLLRYEEYAAYRRRTWGVLPWS